VAPTAPRSRVSGLLFERAARGTLHWWPPARPDRVASSMFIARLRAVACRRVLPGGRWSRFGSWFERNPGPLARCVQRDDANIARRIPLFDRNAAARPGDGRGCDGEHGCSTHLVATLCPWPDSPAQDSGHHFFAWAGHARASSILSIQPIRWRRMNTGRYTPGRRPRPPRLKRNEEVRAPAGPPRETAPLLTWRR